MLLADKDIQHNPWTVKALLPIQLAAKLGGGNQPSSWDSGWYIQMEKWFSQGGPKVEKGDFLIDTCFRKTLKLWNICSSGHGRESNCMRDNPGSSTRCWFAGWAATHCWMLAMFFKKAVFSWSSMTSVTHVNIGAKTAPCFDGCSSNKFINPTHEMLLCCINSYRQSQIDVLEF